VFGFSFDGLIYIDLMIIEFSYKSSAQVYYSDSPLVVCAPTGAGKTVIFELAIIRTLMKINQSLESFNFKVVYSKLH
jgi:ATP-dependent DNA helicase HFM1/MER3